MRLQRVDRCLFQQAPLGVQSHDFAARAKARVDGQKRASPEGRSKEKLPEILSKDLRGGLIRPFLELSFLLTLQRGCKKALVGVLRGESELSCPFTRASKIALLD
jgi:hypothetical protein